MKKAVKVLLIVIATIAALLMLLVGKIDRTPLTQTEHFKAWQTKIAQQDFDYTAGPTALGWAKVNITPDKSGPMAGYGNRWGKHFEAVHDSLFVRVIAIKNPVTTVYLLAADMLIIPPNITTKLESLLQQEHISLDQVHLSATHTHHGQGGWGRKLTGRLFAGAFDEKVEERLAAEFRDAIVQATQHLDTGNIYYNEVEDTDHIRNRLDVTDGLVDPWVRSLIFERADSVQAQLITYGAHPTVFFRKFLQLSRDYPGMLIDSIEKQKNHFGMYMAGAVGSMGFIAEGATDSDRSAEIAHGLIDGLRQRAEDKQRLSDSLMTAYIQVPMPDQSARISQNFALRPWVFRTFFGNYPTYIKVTQIGKVLMLGMPADFSGEIMTALDNYAQQRDIQLIITSFNGSYVGYITPDKRYDEDLYETTTMSWNGYHAGGYFTQVAKDIIDRSAQKR